MFECHYCRRHGTDTTAGFAPACCRASSDQEEDLERQAGRVEHAIPKTTKQVGPRISIQFRPRGLILLALGVYESRKRRAHQSGPTLSGTYADELTAMFYGSKRTELDHRDSWSMMREDDSEGAPPLGVDLDGGTVVLDPDRLDRP
jgi:hypothetical protein